METNEIKCTDFGTIENKFVKTIYLYIKMRYYYDSYKS